MTLRYAVGIRTGNKADQRTVEAEDALIAALKVKTAHPEAAITYVRKQNVRGDRRHPHAGPTDENPVELGAAHAAEPDRKHTPKRHRPGAGASGPRGRQGR
jgi:hypothetical protein